MSTATEEKEKPTGIECRITLNPEMDRVVFCVGESSVGFCYDHAMLMADQLATALELMREQRKRPKGRLN